MAIDRVLQLVCACNLTFFEAEVNADLPFEKEKFLVRWLDEASTQYSLSWWFSYCKNLRIIAIRDLYHREWNDCRRLLYSGAVRRAHAGSHQARYVGALYIGIEGATRQVLLQLKARSEKKLEMQLASACRHMGICNIRCAVRPRFEARASPWHRTGAANSQV